MSNNIKVAREKSGLSQMALCKKLKLSYNTVAFAERGVMCSQETADKLNKFFGLHLKPFGKTPIFGKGTKKKAKRVAKKSARKVAHKAKTSFSKKFKKAAKHADAPAVTNGSAVASEPDRNPA